MFHSVSLLSQAPLARATLIEAPHPQEVNYLAGKEAPSSVLINYLWHYNYSEYSTQSNHKLEQPF